MPQSLDAGKSKGEDHSAELYELARRIKAVVSPFLTSVTHLLREGGIMAMKESI